MPFCLAQKNQCSPSPVVAALYFCTYMLLVVYLMVQLVRALQGRRIILSPARSAHVHLEIVEQRVVQLGVSPGSANVMRCDAASSQVIGIILENIELHSRMENMTVSQQHIQARLLQHATLLVPVGVAQHGSAQRGVSPGNNDASLSNPLPVTSCGVMACTTFETCPLAAHDAQSFREVWEELDTHGDGMIHVTQLTTLLAAVDPPMGVKGLSNTAIRVQAIVQSLEIPLRNQHIHFLVRLSDRWDEQRPIWDAPTRPMLPATMVACAE